MASRAGFHEAGKCRSTDLDTYQGHFQVSGVTWGDQAWGARGEQDSLREAAAFPVPTRAVALTENAPKAPAAACVVSCAAPRKLVCPVAGLD